MTIGIYAIVNLKTGDRYVGQSVNIEKRWVGHRSDLRAGKSHSHPLQEAWNYYGEANFRFQILEECISERLEELEGSYMMEGSSLNHMSGYVVPLAIENELGVDPNEDPFDVDIPAILSELENPTQRITSLGELRKALEDMARIGVELENLVDAVTEFVDNCDPELGDDYGFDKSWEATSENAYGVSSGAIEVLRRVDRLRG